MRSVLEAAVHDAQALVDGGCDAILLENMGDVCEAALTQRRLRR